MIIKLNNKLNKMKKIAVLIPCYNEEKTIEKVVLDFKKVLPESEIYVYNNNSSDATHALAVRAGAIVKNEARQGKGFVVQRMFREVDADIYLLVDGDDTYPAESAKKLIGLIDVDGVDLAVGDRLTNGRYAQENKRGFHNFGNALVRSLVNLLFKAKLKDIMSGYRAFSKDFVKNYPVLVDGFQIETDMTVFALDNNFVMSEIPIEYRDRPVGSFSKLNTLSDGTKVLVTIFNLFRYYKPFIFFSSLSLFFVGMGLLVGLPVIEEFIKTQYVLKVPSAILATALIISGILSFIAGVILDAIRHSSREIFELGMKKNK